MAKQIASLKESVKTAKWLQQSARIIDEVNDKIGFVGYLIAAMCLFTTFEVVSRYVFNRPTIWVWDTNTQLLSAMALLAGGYALLHNSHVRMDVLYSHFGPRMKEVIELISFCILALFCVALIWKSIGIAWHSFVIRETMSGYWQPPLYPLKMLVPVAGILLLFQGLSKLLHSLTYLITGERLK